MSKFDLDLLNDVLVHGTCVVGPDGKRIPPEEWYVKSVDPAASKIDLTQFEGHTPGPWASEFRAGVYSEGQITTKDPSVIHGGIAIVEGQNYGAWRNSDDNGDAEFAANARLIAAAPDLLAAYKAALARAERLDRELEVLSQSHKTIAHQLADEHCRAEAAERQRDEAIAASDARVEAMREACAKVANDHIKCDYPDCQECGTAASIRTFIRALPIPAQEGK